MAWVGALFSSLLLQLIANLNTLKLYGSLCSLTSLMKSWTPHSQWIVSLGNPNWTCIGHAAYVVLALINSKPKKNSNVVSTSEMRDKQESRSHWSVEANNAWLVTTTPLIGPLVKTGRGFREWLALFLIYSCKAVVVYFLMSVLWKLYRLQSSQGSSFLSNRSWNGCKLIRKSVMDF